MTDRAELPTGFMVRLLASVARYEDGRLLVGGSPLRAMRLAPRAARIVDADPIRVRDPFSAAIVRRLLDANLVEPVLERAVSDADLTVVIPVHDRPAQLTRALVALGPSAQVIVVDDGSTDPERIARVAAEAGARIVRMPENRGPAAARNAGLRMVTTEFVAFVDSDVQVGLAELSRLGRHFDDPAVALVGPRVDGRVTGDRPRWFERYEAAGSSLTLGVVPSRVHAGATVGWLPSACLVGRVSALGSGFDEELRVGEDVDLVMRLVGEGRDVRYDPCVVAYHDVRATMSGWLGRKVTYGTSAAMLSRRHPDSVAPANLSPSMAAAALALSVRRAWALPVAAGGLAYAAARLRRTLPAEDGRDRLATSLALRGLGWAVRQEASLAVRHWWPVSAVLLTSRLGRRIVVTAVVVDWLVALCDRRPRSLGEGLGVLAGRRLDDIAYGAGVWLGALCARSTRCLWVRVGRTRALDRS